MTDQAQASGTPWVTAAIVDTTSGMVLYTTVLYWNPNLLTTITVRPSPSLELLLFSSDRDTLVTITGGESARTVDRFILSLRTAPDQAILFNTVALTHPPTTPSPNSPSSTRNLGATTTITPPRSTRTSRPNPTRNGKSKPGIGSGAIAGIAIAGIAILALIIGGWYFWRRKKRRAQLPAATLTEDELARREGDGDKIVLGVDQSAPTAGAYQTQYQEMSGNGLTQELDRSHSYKYAVGGAHELRAEDQPGELQFHGMEEHGRANEAGVVGTHNGGDGRNAETIPIPRANNPTSQVSPHVKAQRKREVEWLEMEETRMRQRREALLQQGGGQHT